MKLTAEQPENAYWLALLYDSGLKLSRIKAMVQRWVLLEGRSVVELFSLTETALSARFGIEPAEATRFLQAAEQAPRHRQQLVDWEAAGITLIALSHPNYPQRLQYTLPPVQQPLLLWAAGPSTIFTRPMVTVLGSANPGEETVAFMQTLIQTLAEEEIGMISGYGRGLDRTAFEQMLQTPQGFGLAVLPMGLTAFNKLTRKLDDPLQAERAALLSPFTPDTPFKEPYGPARNLLIDSLAMAVLVPEVDDESQVRAEMALDRGMPVLVGKEDSPANRALIERGAFLLTDPGEVVELVQQAVIDHSMQTRISRQPANAPARPTPPENMLNDDNDDYALHGEAGDPLAPDEALKILDAQGNMPSALRQKLMAMERRRQQDKTAD